MLSLEKCTSYIYDGTKWKLYTPYIVDNIIRYIPCIITDTPIIDQYTFSEDIIGLNFVKGDDDY